jgi:hypothetical protein
VRVLAWLTTHHGEAEHLGSLVTGQLRLGWLTGLDLADLNREIDRLIARSDIDHWQTWVQREVVL